MNCRFYPVGRRLAAAFLCIAACQVDPSYAIQDVDFAQQIRPILADNCFKCHGPGEEDRQAGLRLDQQKSVFEEFAAVLPGDLEGSELYQRIISQDDDSLMPPPDSGRKLSDEQIQLIQRWIEQGADWQRHWSFVAPTRGSIPEVQQSEWTANPIDNFVLARLEEAGLSPQTEAARHTLIRRVSFDLTGLPPSRELIHRYQAEPGDSWYEQLVDELLESERYGEHMARYWLDAARYGDTHGLHLDNYREMWPYRDWVINAFNQNLSFREFVIAQLAGDLLDQPTDEQLIASGFNRAHITTNEGGSIVEEVYVRNVVDRVSTTGTVFLGLTVGCAQCHDHKFDPISQREFYQLFAFFNNMADDPMDLNIKNPKPVLYVTSEAQRQELNSLEEAVETAKTKLETLLSEYEYVDDDANIPKENTDEAERDFPVRKYTWLDDQLPVGAVPEKSWDYINADEGPVFAGENSIVAKADDQMTQHVFTGALPLRVKEGDRLFAQVYLDPKHPPAEIMLQFNDGNWEHRVFWGEDKIDWGVKGESSRYYAGAMPQSGKWIELEVPAEKVGFKELSHINGMALTQWGGTVYWDDAGVYTSLIQGGELSSLTRWIQITKSGNAEGLPGPLKEIFKVPVDDWSEDQKKQLREYFLQNIHPDARKTLSKPAKDLAAATKTRNEFKNSLTTTLISKENDEIKPAFLLNRGEYDLKGDRVERTTPAALSPFPADKPKNRLGFAYWLLAPENPLTSRVTVNRFWQQIFGTGIVETAEDFGAQGSVPSHPRLLDWLAADFLDSGWNVKRLMKMIVMSSTYRQSSRMSPELIGKDPNNRLLARGPRFRLDAEMLRDQALAVSGLLVNEIGGPGVKPPQPGGLWFAVGYSGSNTVRFKKDEGHEKVHRRSLYTFWKRTSPPPQMNTFDAPSRESCSVRRERTNTPLQALLLMNDPQYVEAARVFAQHAIDAGESVAERAQFMYQSALGRNATDNEMSVLMAQHDSDLAAFASNVEDAKKLSQIGEEVADEKYDPAELASWTMVASLIMNTDEFVSKN